MHKHKEQALQSRKIVSEKAKHYLLAMLTGQKSNMFEYHHLVGLCPSSWTLPQ